MTEITLTAPEVIIDAIATRVATIVKLEIDTTTTATQYMTVAEAAEYLRCSRQRIYDLLSSRRLTTFKEGRRTLIRRDEIEMWVRERA